MKTQSMAITSSKSTKQSIKPAVIKGSQNISYDANVMAQFQIQRIDKQQNQKKNRMQSFMNSTKLNASKLYKEKFEQNISKINSKKMLLQKQKDLKQKYTIVKKTDVKKGQIARRIQIQPTKVEWKSVTQKNIVKIAKEDLIRNECQQSDEGSGIDSDINGQNQSNPKDMMQFRQKIRSNMLGKTKK